MTRSYSEASYGGRKTITMGPCASLTASTNASLTAILRHTILAPCNVIDWNLSVLAGGTDLTAVEFNIAKSLGGTGALTAFGTCDLGLATATIADGTVFDGSATETGFLAGDDVIFAIEGTVGHAMVVQPYVEVQEVFVESDS